MSNIGLQNGNGLGIIIYKDGEVKTLKRVLAKEKREYLSTSYKLVFLFIDEEERLYDYIVYSGGQTGFGISDLCLDEIKKQENIEILAIDPMEIDRLLKEENKLKESRMEDQKAKMFDKVKKLNTEMPQRVTINEKWNIEAVKEEYFYDPKISHRILGEYSIQRYQKDWYSCNNYFSSNGKILLKSFMDNCLWFEGTKEEARELLLTIKKTLNDLKIKEQGVGRNE